MDRARRGALGLAVVLLLLALGSPARAYTLKTLPSGAAVRWHRPRVELQVMPAGSARISQPELVSALGRAAAAWSALPGTPALEVSEGTSSTWASDGVNGVYVLERWPFTDERLAVTVSTYAEGTGALIDTDILINGEMELAVLEPEDADPEEADTERYDLVLVLTHELGHALGLDESDVTDATMWHRIGPGETARRELATDDVDGALALYSGAVDTGPTGPDGGCSVAPHHGAGRVPLAALVAALALALRRRRLSTPPRKFGTSRGRSIPPLCVALPRRA
jgi:MYXO-CTERM domain-containing protein